MGNVEETPEMSAGEAATARPSPSSAVSTIPLGPEAALDPFWSTALRPL